MPRMSEAMLPYQPSLGSATNTRLDTACRHHQQCRVSTDDMLLFTFPKRDQDELQRHKYRYCVHKDEIVISVGRPWQSDSARKRTNNAYPRVISNLGMLAMDNDGKTPLMMMKYMYHFARSLREKKAIIEWFNNPTSHADPKDQDENDITDQSAHAFTKETKAHTPHWLPLMADHLPVGYANTLGWAHPNNGDTMVTVMIGGLRTVMNGDFEVFPGDLLQWYWPFEKDCFKANGERKAYANFWEFTPEGVLMPQNINPAYDLENRIARDFEAEGGADSRQKFYAREYGNASEKSVKLVPRIKPYIPDDENPRMYDGIRVFAIALGAARPHEAVDIKISRQSV